MRTKELINWGSYDVDNFGDLLFPFLVEHFLGREYSDILHVSPTGTPSIWPDAKQSLTIIEALGRVSQPELIVGGGNLINTSASSSINYVEKPAFAKIVHESFAWVPYVLLANYGIPYAYNCIGVAKSIPPAKRQLIRCALEAASFISCRDEASLSHLRLAGVRSPIVVAPDSAVDVARVFPIEAMRVHYATEVRLKYALPSDGTTAVIHVKERYLKDDFPAFVMVLELLCASGVHPILVPLGMCHRDDRVLTEPRLRDLRVTCIQKPERILDILSMLAVSRYYLGSSLHGAITALAYGNGIAIVADEEASRLKKFSGFLSHVSLGHCLFDSWKDACASLAVAGMDICETMSDATARAMATRPDPWEAIIRGFRTERPALRLTVDVDLARTAREHYLI